jgi:hypothetical protein
VDALRPDQLALLAEHRERGTERLAAVIAGTPLGDPRRSPEGEALLKDDPELLVAVAVCVVAADRDAAELGHGEAIWVTGRSAVPAMLLRALRPRRLPWTPRDAELLLDLSAGSSLVNMEFAVAVAQRVLTAHPADPDIKRALASAGTALEGMGLGGGARVRALKERIVGDEVVRPKSSKRPGANPARAFGAALLDELAARGFTDRKGRESWRFFPDRVEAVSARTERGAPLVDVGVGFEAARHGLLGRFKTYFCDFRGMARLAPDVGVEEAVARTLAWFEHWQAPAVIDLVLSESGLVDLHGFETGGPRGLDTPAANVLVGYLAVAAGRPELRQPCLERAAQLYREVLDLTDPPNEELAALVERLEADA